MNKTERIMRSSRKHIVGAGIAAMLAAVLFCGCVPDRKVKSHEKALAETSKPAIEAFLRERYGEADAAEPEMLTGYEAPGLWTAGRCDSNVMSCDYTVDGKTYTLAYDSETETFYTSELYEKLMAYETEKLVSFLEKNNEAENVRDIRITELKLIYTVESHDIKEKYSGGSTITAYTDVEEMLPAELTAEDIPMFAEAGFGGGVITLLEIHYFSDKIGAFTTDSVKKFISSRPAYRISSFLYLFNDNENAASEIESKKENISSAESTVGRKEDTFEAVMTFEPEPADPDADCRIKYKNGTAFSRRPYFTEENGVIHLRFNAIDWYQVRIVKKTEAEACFPDERMLAASRNIKVFRSCENQMFDYTCLFEPGECGEYIFVFETDDAPYSEGFGFGFDGYIEYFVNDKKVVPDTKVFPAAD